MGNCASLTPIMVKNELTPQEISNLLTEFDKFQETHCEFSDKYYIPFNDLCAAFWSYVSKMKMPVTFMNVMIKSIVTLSPKLQLSGFKITYGTYPFNVNYNYTHTHVVGMRLKSFPLLPGVNEKVVL
jgi:hypothetical protein